MIRFLFCLLLFGIVASAANANTLRFKLGFWPGPVSPQMERRLLEDDVLAGSGVGRVDLAWERTDVWMIPFGIELRRTLGPGEIFARFDYLQYSPEYRFQSIGPAYYATTTLSGATIIDREGAIGYAIPLLEKRLTLSPEIGARTHLEDYYTDEKSIGFGNISLTAKSPFHAGATGAVLGLSASWAIMDKLSVFAGYWRTPIPITGTMRDERNTYGISGTTGFLQFDRIQSSYEVDISRWAIGAEYKITDRLRAQGGLREETLRTRYPDFRDLPVSLIGGTVTFPIYFTEIATDIIIWSKPQTERKFFLFAGLSYDIEF